MHHADAYSTVERHEQHCRAAVAATAKKKRAAQLAENAKKEKAASLEEAQREEEELKPTVQLQKLLVSEEHFAKACDAVFDDFDTSKNGVLDEDEVHKMIAEFAKKYGTPLPAPEKIKQLFSKMDRRKDGVLHRDELAALYLAVCQSGLASLQRSNPW